MNHLRRLFSRRRQPKTELAWDEVEHIMDEMIRCGITEKKMLRFVYNGHERIVEPHLYGRKNDKNGMMVYQKAGTSSDGELGWKRMYMKKMVGMEVLDKTFPGMRPETQHSVWDFIYLIVDE